MTHQKIRIVTDSTADLPAGVSEQNGISVIPALLILEGQEFADGAQLSRKDFYRRLPELKTPPTTAAPSSGSFQKVYADLFAQGAEHVVSIHVASTLSGIYAAAKVGAEAFDGRVTVLDSGQLSLGLGFQALAAAEAAEAGRDLDTVLDAVHDTRDHTHVIAMLDTLEYLRRGGRVSFVQAGLSALLRVRLFVELHEGRIRALEQVRTRRKAVSRLWEMVVALGTFQRFAVLHADAEEEALLLLDRLRLHLPENPLLVNVNTVIGTHVGPGALGFAAVARR